jgi:hypothetical protein
METIKRWIISFVFAMCTLGLAACANPQAVPILTDKQVKQLLDAYPSSLKTYRSSGESRSYQNRE